MSISGGTTHKLKSTKNDIFEKSFHLLSVLDMSRSLLFIKVHNPKDKPQINWEKVDLQ